MFTKIKESIVFFFTLRFRFFLSSYSEQWDKELNELLKTCEPKLGRRNSIDGQFYTLHLGPRVLWIQNYPYSYAKPIVDVDKMTFWEVRPSKKTIFRLNKIVKELVKKERYKRKINISEFKLLR